jgi:hypothetical protein
VLKHFSVFILQRAGQKAIAIWLKPQYKAEVTFLEWTQGGFLGHAQIKQVLL